MMSQNSQLNGQPREYCTDIELYCFKSAILKSGTGVNESGGRSTALYVRLVFPDSRSATNSGNVVSASPMKTWSASGRSSTVVVTYGPPSTTLLPSALHFLTTSCSESFCTSMPVTKTMSAHSISESFIDLTLRSTNRRSQDFGNREETVSRPSGGKAQLFRSKGSACRKLQYVSGNSGFTMSTFIASSSDALGAVCRVD